MPLNSLRQIQLQECRDGCACKLVVYRATAVVEDVRPGVPGHLEATGECVYLWKGVCQRDTRD